jgi:hypothetical protein
MADYNVHNEDIDFLRGRFCHIFDKILKTAFKLVK